MKTKLCKLTVVLIVLVLASGLFAVARAPVPVHAATEKTMYVKWDKIKVYKKASTKSEVVKTLKRNKKVTMLTAADENGWVKIEYKTGKKGYVKKKQLSAKTENQVKAAAAEYGYELNDPSYTTEIDSDDGRRIVWYHYTLAGSSHFISVTNQVHISYSSTKGKINSSDYRWYVFNEDADMVKMFANSESNYKGLMSAIKKYS